MSKDLPSRDLEINERARVIEWLALRRDPVQIRQDFLVLYEKPISGKQIDEISLMFGDKIIQTRDALLNDLDSEPLAHAKIRLGNLSEAMMDAKTMRILSSYRVGENEWETDRGMNLSAIVAINREARAEEFMYKKFWLEVKKLKIEQESEAILKSGIPNIRINTGIEDAPQEHTNTTGN